LFCSATSKYTNSHAVTGMIGFGQTALASKLSVVGPIRFPDRKTSPLVVIQGDLGGGQEFSLEGCLRGPAATSFVEVAPAGEEGAWFSWRGGDSGESKLTRHWVGGVKGRVVCGSSGRGGNGGDGRIRSSEQETPVAGVLLELTNISHRARCPMKHQLELRIEPARFSGTGMQAFPNPWALRRPIVMHRSARHRATHALWKYAPAFCITVTRFCINNWRSKFMETKRAYA